jgi:hypothetical protein
VRLSLIEWLAILHAQLILNMLAYSTTFVWSVDAILASSMDFSHYNSLPYHPTNSLQQPPPPSGRPTHPRMHTTSSHLDLILSDIPMVESDYYEESHEHTPTRDCNDYTLTKDGYKSFSGGWIEGLSENQEVYFYNFRTGESAWHLPDLIENQSNAIEPLSPLSAHTNNHQPVHENYCYSTQYGSGYDSLAMNGEDAGPVFYEGDQRILAPNYSQKLDSQYAYDQSYRQQQQQEGYGGYPGEPASDYHQELIPYDPTQQQQYQEYYEDPAYQQQYAEYEQDYNYNQYPYYDEATGYGYDEQGYAIEHQTHSQYLTDGSWKISDAMGLGECVQLMLQTDS